MGKGIEAVLSVDNIRVHAYHGWYPEERMIGGMYNINVRMFRTVDQTEHFSNLEASINYELIYDLVLDTMKQEFHLIEHCCKALFDKLKGLDNHSIWEVHLIKEEPPLNFVGATSFKLKG